MAASSGSTADMSTSSEAAPTESIQVGTAASVPEDWIGFELGVAPPSVRYLGTVEPSVLGPDLTQFSGEGELGTPAGLDSVSQVGPETMQWIEVNAQTGDVYEMTAPRADVYEIHEWMVEHDFDKARGPGGVLLPEDPSMGEDAELPDTQELEALPGLAIETPMPQTWSDGDDSRERMAIADGFSANHFPFKTIAWMDTGFGCSGTLIGETVLLTAAHCFWGANGFVQHDVVPRADGTMTQPHGSAQLDRYWMASSFEDGTCGDSIACNKYDIAVAELTDDLGNATGAMGYHASNTTATQSYDIRMRGYPSCHSTYAASRPESCDAATLYGSEDLCNASEFHSGGCLSDGWYCEFRATCDGSAGQSGSAAYTYDVAGYGGNPAAIAVYSQANCTGTACMNDPRPNEFTRITPDRAVLISFAKSVWGSW